MIRKLIEIVLDHMRMAIAQKLSELGLPLSDELLPSIIMPYVGSLYSSIDEHLFNERTRITTESVQLQLENERIKKENDEKLASKDKEIEKARVSENKYKRLLEEEKKECIRQKEWNQALVKIIKDNGLKLPENVPHTYIAPTPKPTSDNSSLPPSKNPIGYSRGYTKRPKSDKTSGGQFGHKGATRDPEEIPTEVVECAPERCSYCNHPLEEVEGKEGETRQVVDVPEIINLEIVNYVSVQKKCPHCGAINKGIFPDTANAHFSYGPRLIATVVLLCHYMNCSWNKIVSFLECIYGLHISQGTVGNILKRFALNCQEDYEKIKELIKKGKVVYADETVITVDGKKRHVWIFITDDGVYLIYNRSRCKEVLLEEFPDGFPDSIFVSDRYAAYFYKEFKVKNHQVCLPHLVRNCRGLEEKAPNCKWVKDFKDFLERAMKADKDPSIDRDKLFLDRDDLLSKEPFFNDPKERKKVIGFFHNMQKSKDYILLFLTHPKVPHNNNRSERGLRPCKSKAKQIGTFRSEHGPEEYVKTLSVLQSCDANGEDKFDKLVSIAKKSKPKKKDKPNSETDIGVT